MSRYPNLEKLTFSSSGLRNKKQENSVIKSLNIFSQLKTLELEKLRLNEDNLLLLASAFTNLTQLSSLKIRGIYLPADISQTLSSVFLSCPTLEEITIHTLRVEFRFDFLPNLSSLKYFKLRTVFVDYRGMIGLLKSLPYLSSLQKLKLEIDSLNNTEAKFLLNVISKNTTLCHLSLKGATSSEGLINKIKDLLEKNITLQSLKMKHEMPQEVENLLARNRKWAVTLESLAIPPQKSPTYASNEFRSFE